MPFVTAVTAPPLLFAVTPNHFLCHHSHALDKSSISQPWDIPGRLYTQIGALKKLGIFYLKAAGQLSHVPDIPHTDTCLPALLALDNPANNKISYLSKLFGLTKLR
ncbi:hypothetical protein BGX30_010407 [Mortierella sp. GBA39]|nr:hypothetical protein BGX30_010407 [Mortierella sp. GBA39]